MASGFRSVLVVEGDSAMREMLVAQLEEEGIQARPAASAAEAVAGLSREPVSVVLAALDLPDLDELSLLPELRRSGIPVVFMAPFGSAGGAQRARAAGALDCLVKPFGPGELLGALERAFALAG